MEHAEHGESKHGVHLLNTYCLKKEIISAADETIYPEAAEKYGTFDVPKTYHHLYGDEEKMVTLDYETPIEQFGGRTAFQVALDCFDRCISQKRIGNYTVYGTGHKHATHKFGLYRSTVGEDVELNDLFENIN